MGLSGLQAGQVGEWMCPWARPWGGQGSPFSLSHSWGAAVCPCSPPPPHILYLECLLL